jgi:hypothetical protein
VGGALRPQHADQRVGDDLHQHHAGREDEIGQQEHREGGGLARRDEQQAARHHRQQSGDCAAHIAQLLDQSRARDADHGVGDEEPELHQARFKKAEREQLFELGDDHIVKAGDPAEYEEQRKDEIVEARRVNLRRITRAAAHALCRTRARCHCHCCSLPVSRFLRTFTIRAPKSTCKRLARFSSANSNASQPCAGITLRPREKP